MGRFKVYIVHKYYLYGIRLLNMVTFQIYYKVYGSLLKSTLCMNMVFNYKVYVLNMVNMGFKAQ